MRTNVAHRGPEALRLGVVVAEGVHPETVLPPLDLQLEARLTDLAGGLSEPRDAYRAAVRDVFRNGRYKPTGRGKPASEYLLKAASEQRFPRINALVDICNYLSVASLLPISIWDLDLAARHAGRKGEDDLPFEFRLGAVDEEYVFNSAGQSIGLEDLIVGTVVSPSGEPLPIVNAIKDSQATKTTAATRRVAAAIYAPMSDGPDMSLDAVCASFCELLTSTHASCRCTHAILMPGASMDLQL